MKTNKTFFSSGANTFAVSLTLFLNAFFGFSSYLDLTATVFIEQWESNAYPLPPFTIWYIRLHQPLIAVQWVGIAFVRPNWFSTFFYTRRLTLFILANAWVWTCTRKRNLCHEPIFLWKNGAFQPSFIRFKLCECMPCVLFSWVVSCFSLSFHFGLESICPCTNIRIHIYLPGSVRHTDAMYSIWYMC